MKHLALPFAFALLAACGGSQKPKTAAAPTCADAAAHAEGVLAADQAAAAMAPMVSGLVAERCPADGWSPDVIACITGAATHDALHQCIHALTPEQHDRFHAAMEAQGGGEHMMKEQEGDAMPPPSPARSKAPTDPCGGDE